MKIINERSSFDYPVRWLDEEGKPFAPSTVHWRVWCETSEKAVSGWAAATTVTETDELGQVTGYRSDITVTSPLNVLQSSDNDKEFKRLVVVANKDANDELPEGFPYIVRKVPGLSD